MIQEVKRYTDDVGRNVMAYVPMVSSEEHPKVRYEGTVGIRTPMGVMPIHFDFPEDYTLPQCFQDFEKVADVEIQKVKQEAEDQNLIVTPGQTEGKVIPFKI